MAQQQGHRVPVLDLPRRVHDRADGRRLDYRRRHCQLLQLLGGRPALGHGHRVRRRRAGGWRVRGGGRHAEVRELLARERRLPRRQGPAGRGRHDERRPTTAAYNAGTQTLYSGAASKKTTGTLLAVECDFVIMGAVCVTLTGTIPFTYANPSSVGGVLWPPAIVADTALDATLMLRSTGQTWAAAGPGCPGLPNPGAAPSRLQKPGGGDLTLPLSGGTDQPVLWYGDL